MEINNIISTLRQQFLEETDEGLLFGLKPEDFHSKLKLTDTQLKLLREIDSISPSKIDLPEKKDIIFYLCVSFIRRNSHSFISRIRYNEYDFHQKFWDYWINSFDKVKATLEKVPIYLNAETIDDKDQIYYSINSQHYVSIFILTTKYIINLVVGPDNPLRTQHIIQRDIKKIEATDRSVYIHFHGLHNPQVIMVDTYKSAIKLQQHLTDLRDKKPFFHDKKQTRK